ncbi:metallophosphoesterase [Acidisphaera sp. S103]|uniref:metallophosphoesterase n=1 Tax=Acidisphaera sp. S103 TaxID=1747223 RepID=UPI00131D423C|nr:metallophosphoesterase [Acidisphaera sp. S103]
MPELEQLAQDSDPLTWLKGRLGPLYALTRLQKEGLLEARRSRPWLRQLTSLYYVLDLAVPLALRMTGTMRWGQRNARAIRVVKNEVFLANLPAIFDGFTILHLADLHADISEGVMAALPGVLAQLEYDVCVFTGDFRGKVYGPHARSEELVVALMSAIRQPTFGVLGNHDTALLIRGLERAGINMLMNENAPIVRGNDRIWIAGVDDPHYYRMDDLAAAVQGIPDDDVVVLLSHSTDGYERAADGEIELMLCGHTHGGQICLPGGLPVMTSSKHPRRLAAGPWRIGGMAGYTSRGIGTSVVEARFNCAPEVVLHTLRRS